MEKRPDIILELQEISQLLAGISAETPFRVPDGYFAQFPETVLDTIQTETFLANASAETLRVPLGYFEGLSTSIMDKITTVSTETEVASELNEVAPLLNTISREEIYTVPQGYFDTIDFAVSAQSEKQPAKVITLRIARKWMQYAAAALVAGVLVTGAFLYTDNNSNLLENEQYTGLDAPSGLNKVSEDELVSYLDNPEHITAAPATSLLASDDELKEVKNTIRQLSDEELNQYLQDYGEPFESAAATEKE